MSKTMKYWYRAKNNIIQSLQIGYKVPKVATSREISKEDYDKYRNIMNSIEERDGYESILTLYVDFTYTVEYIPIEHTE